MYPKKIALSCRIGRAEGSKRIAWIVPIHFFILFSFVYFVFPDFSPAQIYSAVWNKQYSVHWNDLPLHKTLSRFAEDHQFDFVLDRRIDPSVRLDFTANGVPLGKILSDLADSLDLGCFFLKNLVYFGPKDSALMLPRLLSRHREEIESLSASERSLFRKKIKTNIPFLGNPKDALETIAKQSHSTWKNLDDLPHDLWNETNFSNLSTDETLTLILIGFEFDYHFENRQFELVPIKRSNNIKEIPEVSTQKKATASLEKRDEIDTADRSNASDNIPLSRRRFTLKIEEQNLRAVLETLAIRMNLELELNKASLEQKQISLERPVSLDVKNATAQQLFRSLLRPLKIEFRIQDDTLRIY